MIQIEPLTSDAFAPFGTVIERPRHGGFAANDGTALRFDDIAKLVLTAPGGRPLLSWMRVNPVALPFPCRKLERHPRSTQLFMPLRGQAFLVVVAAGEEPTSLRAFITNGAQGINYAVGTWHHAALALDAETDFLVLGHASESPDCDFYNLPEPGVVVTSG